MVIGATTIGRELRDKQLGHWYGFIASAQAYDNLNGSISANISDSANISGNVNNNVADNTVQNIAALSQPAAKLPNSTAKDNTNQKPVSTLPSVHMGVLLFGLLGKYFWPMLAYGLWSILALWLATPQESVASSAVFATYLGLLLLMMLSFWLGAIFTLGSFSLRMGLSATGFISAPSYAFAGVTFPYIAISDSAKHWSDALPLTHYLKLHIAQMQMQAPVAISLPILYGLAIATVVAMMLTALLTKRALAHPERWGAR